MYTRFPVKLLVSSIATCLPLTAMAATDAEVDQLRQQIQDLTQRYESQNAALRAVAARLQQIEAGTPSKARFIKTAETTQTTEPAGAEANSPDAAGGEKVVKEAPATRSAEAVYQEQHALFDRKFTLETGLTYSHSDRRDLALNGFLALDAIFLGNINLDRIKSDIVTLDVTGRYSLTDRLQLDLDVPYVYRSSNFSSVGAGDAANQLSEQDVSNANVGDVSAGGYYRLFKETTETPDTIISLRVKAPTGKNPYGIKFVKDPTNNNLQVPTDLPTGNGIWSMTAGVSFIKTIDPAILFANLGYTYNFQRSFSDLNSDPTLPPVSGTVDLGNQYSLGAGMAFALNERMSLSMSYSHRFADKTRTKQNGNWTDVIGSDFSAGSVNFGVTYGMTDRLSMVANVGVGVTPDSPDITVGVKFPYSF